MVLLDPPDRLDFRRPLLKMTMADAVLECSTSAPKEEWVLVNAAPIDVLDHGPDDVEGLAFTNLSSTTGRSLSFDNGLPVGWLAADFSVTDLKIVYLEAPVDAPSLAKVVARQESQCRVPHTPDSTADRENGRSVIKHNAVEERVMLRTRAVRWTDQEKSDERPSRGDRSRSDSNQDSSDVVQTLVGCYLCSLKVTLYQPFVNLALALIKPLPLDLFADPFQLGDRARRLTIMRFERRQLLENIKRFESVSGMKKAARATRARGTHERWNMFLVQGGCKLVVVEQYSDERFLVRHVKIPRCQHDLVKNSLGPNIGLDTTLQKVLRHKIDVIDQFSPLIAETTFEETAPLANVQDRGTYRDSWSRCMGLPDTWQQTAEAASNKAGSFCRPCARGGDIFDDSIVEELPAEIPGAWQWYENLVDNFRHGSASFGVRLKAIRAARSFAKVRLRLDKLAGLTL
jgi:hypothetical protein